MIIGSLGSLFLCLSVINDDRFVWCSFAFTEELVKCFIVMDYLIAVYLQDHLLHR